MIGSAVKVELAWCVHPAERERGRERERVRESESESERDASGPPLARAAAP